MLLILSMHVCDSLCSHNGKTPLLCAAEAGHDEVVAYLFEFREVQTNLKYQPEVVKNANVRLHLVDIHVKDLKQKSTTCTR